MSTQLGDIDVKQMIKLVATRPIIWDKSLTSRSRKATDEAWEEVCEDLDPEYREMTDEDKERYGKTVMYKWRNIRDQWLKDCKKAEAQKRSGAATKYVRKYIYHDEMAFLNKNLISNETEESTEQEMEEAYSEDSNNIEIAQPELNFPPGALQVKKLRLSTIDENCYKYKQSEQTLENRKALEEKDDQKLCFFKSLLQSINDFSCDEFLELQTQVLLLIQEIRRRRMTQTFS